MSLAALGSRDDLLGDMPGAPPPPGITPNFINPPSQARGLLVVDFVFVALTLLAVSIRVFVRRRLTKSWGWDDNTCILAALGSVALTVVYIELTKIGYGRHIWDIPMSWLQSKSNLQLFYTPSLTYPFIMLCAKASILLLYLRLFSVSQHLTVAIHVGIAVLALFYTAITGTVIVCMVQCTDITTRNSKQFCLNFSGPVLILIAAFNVLTDLWILALPLPLILRLRLRYREKLGVVVVFTAGLAACAASLARLVLYARQYHASGQFETWLQGTSSEFTIVELNISIIVACVPCFPPFFRHVSKRISMSFWPFAPANRSSPDTISHSEVRTIPRPRLALRNIPSGIPNNGIHYPNPDDDESPILSHPASIHPKDQPHIDIHQV
ncbi:hypothetical protein B0T19DRAFT_199736 [Cercophora scortea]|uniref:Rhodopsin domain-containing protein n=1 Tax=Cercophora scortea TaxID=314031 RepID=A0AAE0IDT0_9PEZI|nr:hypothetical protein B0T19DRAFT_199736 [Cercophora scortea]